MTKDEKREYDREYYQKNQEKILARKKEYAVENADGLADYRHRHYVENREEILARNKAYIQSHPEVRQARFAAYRGRQKAAEGSFTGGDIKAQYASQDGKCFWCGKKVYKNYHIDHVIPLSQGGTNWPDNLVIACPSCNTSKGGKMPDEWVRRGTEDDA